MDNVDEEPCLPDFLLKSTMGVALISALILVPFSINNFLQGRAFLGMMTMLTALLCVVDAWLCRIGQYHRGVNLYIVSPVVTLSIALAVWELGVMGSYWAFLAVFSFYFILPKRLAWKMNAVFAGVVLPVAWTVLDQPEAIRFTAVLFGTSIYAYVSLNEITRQHEKIREQATTDPLTGLYNRLLVQTSLEHAISIAQRERIPMSLAMLDLDHFKAINDDLGHDVGDEVLRKVAALLKSHFRDTDRVFRIGGEEFLVLLHHTEGEVAARVTDRLRQEISSRSILPDRVVTLSAGVCTLRPGMNWQQWIKQCDGNLYRAKDEGRDRVVADGDELSACVA